MRRQTGTRQRIDGPASFFVSGLDGVWVWQPERGLVKYNDPFEDGRALRFSISHDGTILRYEDMGARSDIPMFEMDLLTGVRSELSAVQKSQSRYFGASGQECFVTSHDRQPLHSTRSSYEVIDAATSAGPVSLSLEYRTRGLLDGPSVQFEPSGHRLAISVDVPGDELFATYVFDTDGTLSTRISGFLLSGCASWSLDGTRLIGKAAAGSAQPASHLLALLDIDQRKTCHVPFRWLGVATILGWYDNDRILAWSRQQRQVTFIAVDARTGETEDVGGFRLPVPAGYLHTIGLAAGALRRDPAAIESAVQSRDV